MVRLRKLRSLFSWLVLTAYVALGMATAGHVHALAGEVHTSCPAGAIVAGPHAAGEDCDEPDGSSTGHDDDHRDCPICDAALVASAIAVPSASELPEAPTRTLRLAPVRPSPLVELQSPASFYARGPPLSRLDTI